MKYSVTYKAKNNRNKPSVQPWHVVDQDGNTYANYINVDDADTKADELNRKGE